MKNDSTETTEITNLNETETRPSYTSKAGSPTSYRLEPCAFFAHRDSLTSASPSVRTGVMNVVVRCTQHKGDRLAKPQHSRVCQRTRKLGLKVESTKSEAGERTYRVVG